MRAMFEVIKKEQYASILLQEIDSVLKVMMLNFDMGAIVSEIYMLSIKKTNTFILASRQCLQEETLEWEH